MKTREQMREELMTLAREEIAVGLAMCALEGGRGVEVRDGVVRCRPQGEVEVPGEERRAVRYARDLRLEVRGGKIYVNFPPVRGVVATLGGVGLFDEPRPFLEPEAGARWVYIKVAYVRTNVTISGSTVGLGLGAPTVTVHVVAAGSAPGNVTPGSGSDYTPYAGSYERYYWLGVVTGLVVDVNVTTGGDLFPAIWGGLDEQTVATFGSTRWEFLSNVTAP